MMRFPLRVTLISMILAGGPVLASAQTVKVDSRQTQLLLAASSTATLQTELDQAGALGFHPVMATTRGNGELVVLLQRDLKANEKVQLHLAATTATGTFDKEIKEMALQGYRVVPLTFLNKPAGLGSEIVTIMERTVNPSKRYEYKLIATDKTSTMESEWGTNTSLGYRPIGFITRGEVMLLLERETK